MDGIGKIFDREAYNLLCPDINFVHFFLQQGNYYQSTIFILFHQIDS